MSDIKNCRMELLSPAGSFDTFKAVINAGADSVYAAGNKFGARAYAANFSEEELIRAIDYTNLLGKRFYLTVNTLFKEDELNILCDYTAPFYERGLSGVIVQDMGAAMLLKNTFPGLEIHASTQMAIFSAAGAKMLENAGFSQLVLPREMSLEEIKTIAENTKLRIETFVHGALCYCVSGQCLFSSILGGRSGNRGRCAQPCRLPYEAKGKKCYPLSPKDLCGIDSLNDLYKAGVYSLKIEGRMKSPEYAAGVTKLYREKLDEVLDTNGSAKPLSEKMKRQLLDLGNRSGFTNGYIKGENENMIAINNPSHEKADNTFFVPDTELKKLKVNIFARLKKGENAYAEFSLGDKKASAEGSVCQKAEKSPVTKETAKEKLTKLGNTPFEAGDVIIEAEDDIFMPASELNNLRRSCTEALTAMFMPYEPKRNIFDISKMSSAKEIKKPMLEVMLTKKEQLEEALKNKYVKKIILDCHYFYPADSLSDLCEDVKNAGKEVYYALPVIFDDKTLKKYTEIKNILKGCGFNGFMARTFDEIGFLNKEFEDPFIIADESVYCWNSGALKYYKNTGVKEFSIPCELNFGEIKTLDNSSSAFCIYTTTPLMTSRQCVVKNTDKCKKNPAGNDVYLKDRYKKEFKVHTFCDICANRIYNSLPTALFQESRKVSYLNAAFYRIVFTDEDRKQAAYVFEMYEKAFVNNEKVNFDGEFTYGHFKRGVE
ncbi:MAG: U32 family peptidase [Eubacterium sp.]|nr:U32 family peptidase [Eubacterium sp.]